MPADATDRENRCTLGMLDHRDGSTRCKPASQAGRVNEADSYPCSFTRLGPMQGLGPMAFLFAHRADGSLRHFEKSELAFFFPNSVGKLSAQGGLTFAEFEIIVFGDLQWFKGTVDCHDLAYDSPDKNVLPSIAYPTAPHAKLEPPTPPPPPPSRNSCRHQGCDRKSVRRWQRGKPCSTSSGRWGRF